jgi:FAD/FMN-containing dehydrogenase
MTGVLRPGDAGYDDERVGFQAAVEHRPEVIFAVDGTEDVRAAVEFAAGHGLPVAVKATGHGLAVPASGGVLISTRRMTGVQVDKDARSASLEAGARWDQVIGECVPHGLAPLSGSAPHVGAVGYTLGGGLGLLSRRYGYAADSVRSMDVVTPDGRLRHVTADSEPDLFWALRGGRDNFGVVTKLEVDLVPVARLYGGGLYFAGDRAASILDTYLTWTGAAPEEMTSSLALMRFPDLPAIPEPIRGRYVAHIRIAYAGDHAEGEQPLAPLRAAGPRLLETIRDMPYAESGSIHNDPVNPVATYSTNVLLSTVDSSVL